MRVAWKHLERPASRGLPVAIVLNRASLGDAGDPRGSAALAQRREARGEAAIHTGREQPLNDSRLALPRHCADWRVPEWTRCRGTRRYRTPRLLSGCRSPSSLEETTRALEAEATQPRVRGGLR